MLLQIFDCNLGGLYDRVSAEGSVPIVVGTSEMKLAFRTPQNPRPTAPLPDYAAEERIAEIGASFLCTDLGPSKETRDTARLTSALGFTYLRKIRAQYSLQSKAQTAVDWIITRGEGNGRSSMSEGFAPATRPGEVFTSPGPLPDLAVWQGKWAGGSLLHFLRFQSIMESRRQGHSRFAVRPKAQP